MNAVLSETDRGQIRRMSRAVSDANRAQNAERQWKRRTLEVLRDGPATRYELAVELCGAGTSPNTVQRNAISKAVLALIEAGMVRERPEIESTGRAVRVEPVMVLELVEPRPVQGVEG